MYIIRCKCGLCDELILTPDVHGKPVYYSKNHNSKINPLTERRNVKIRTSRERGMKILRDILKKDKCEVDNHICSGGLQTHHIDKNPFNNSLDNLLLLCITHYNFADKRNLSLNELKNLNPTYYISSNKRRYKFEN